MSAPAFASLKRYAPAELAPAVLNPGLVRAMTAALGAADVADRGTPLEGDYFDDPHRGRRLRITRWGELYRADCPFCGDERGRLSVSHTYGIYDPETDDHGWNRWRCFNEECQESPDNRRELRRRLTFSWLGARRLEPCRPRPADQLAPCAFPGELTPVDALPADHPVAAYLRDERRFDLTDLAATWGVAYATHVPLRVRGSMAQGRVIVPVRQGGTLVGWQARYPGELDWKATGVPKYLEYFPKSLAVYGLDALPDGAAVVPLFEGVTDVWRYGPGGVCGFGKGLSVPQARLLAGRLGPRTLVLVPDYDDPESEPAFFEAADRLRAEGFSGRLGIAPLPAGRDPASLTTGQLRRVVELAARLAE